jgi:hypothetical protein
MLAANQASLQRQTCRDWSQTLMRDAVGVGIAATYERLADYVPEGDWVWILDDDDLCVDDRLVAELDQLDRLNVDVIMVKMERDGHVLPDKFTWHRPPQLGHICVSCYLVRRDVWMQNRRAFAPGHYASDYNFIAAVFGHDPEVYWLDRVVAKTQRISRGKPENE